VCGTTVCANPPSAPDVWYFFKLLCDGLVTIDTCGLCSGQSAGFNSVLSVYSGTCGGSLVASAQCSQQPVTFPGTAQTYYIRVAGAGMVSGDFRLNITAPSPAPINDKCSGAIP